MSDSLPVNMKHNQYNMRMLLKARARACVVLTHTAGVVPWASSSHVLHDLQRVSSHWGVQPEELQPPVIDPQVLDAAFKISTKYGSLPAPQQTSHKHSVSCLDRDRPDFLFDLSLGLYVQCDAILHHRYVHKVDFPIVDRTLRLEALSVVELNCDLAVLQPHVQVLLSAAVGERQEESAVPPCAQEEGDGEVVAQIIGDSERSITRRVLVPKAGGDVFCKKGNQVRQ